MCHGKEKVKNEMKRIELLGQNATQKDGAMYETLEIVNEMYERGITFYQLTYINQEQQDLKWKMKE